MLIIVVKLGGSILEEEVSPSFIKDLQKITEDNKVLLVHGGKKTVNKISEKMGKKPQFIVSPRGFKSRYTDRETMEIFIMVMAGKINKSIVSSLIRNHLKAVGLSGIDGGFVIAERKKNLITVDESGRKRIIEGGYTGTIKKVDTHLIGTLLEAGYIPVISPIALGEEFEELNIDGDRMAAHVASSLKADLLILLTDVTGVIVDGSLKKQLRLQEAKSLLSHTGHGMITKLYAATEALENGVKEVIITSGIEGSSLQSALQHTTGTVITND